jgi:hypothetical protein
MPIGKRNAKNLRNSSSSFDWTGGAIYVLVVSGSADACENGDANSLAAEKNII